MFSILNDVTRLMKLTFPRNNGPQSTLLINELIAEEHLSSDFTFTLQLLSDNADIALKDVQGKMVCVELLRDDRSTRYFNGYCFEFSLQKIDNGTAVYQMILKPWLALLRLRTDFYIFHNQTLAEQTKEIFLDYGTASYEIKIHDGDHKRTFTVQYDESDYNFLHRHWEEHGLHYWYEHTASGHRLMLSDYSMAAEPIDGNPAIPLHHDGGSNKFDKISNWQPQRSIVSGKVSYSSFDFKAPTPVVVTDTSQHRQGDVHKIEVYRYHGLYGYKDSAMGALLAKRRMEQIDASGKTFTATSDSRYIKPGRWFRLTKDSLSQSFQGSNTEYEFLILRASHTARNNLLNSEGGEAYYSNSFTCLRRNVRWRPPVGFNSQPIKVAGNDTATVVGPAGEEIYTDKYGRIKVQFHWDRMGKLDEKSSCWLRVATPWADKNFGMIAIPRIGTEVLIGYLQGNPDRPYVAGQFYNQRDSGSR
ncbi:MAG: type VI secretion system tip protein VgrG [Burkholderiales bacterium]|nr:type VI secretion system tip protein VgrG [Burkholderiales bacterium]